MPATMALHNPKQGSQCFWNLCCLHANAGFAGLMEEMDVSRKNSITHLKDLFTTILQAISSTAKTGYVLRGIKYHAHVPHTFTFLSLCARRKAKPYVWNVI